MTMRELVTKTRMDAPMFRMMEVGKHYNLLVTTSGNTTDKELKWFAAIGPADTDATGYGATPDEALHHAMVQQMLLEELAVAKAALEAA
jgi:hypothetical protein